MELIRIDEGKERNFIFDLACEIDLGKQQTMHSILICLVSFHLKMKFD